MPPLFQEFLDELARIDEPNQKLKFLLELSGELPEFPESEKIPAHKISGCASNAYIVAEFHKGKMSFRGDADAQIPKGVLALFVLGCSDATPQEILHITPEMLEQSGLKNILSPSRANGAFQIFERIRSEALHAANI